MALGRKQAVAGMVPADGVADLEAGIGQPIEPVRNGWHGAVGGQQGAGRSSKAKEVCAMVKRSSVTSSRRLARRAAKEPFPQHGRQCGRA
jgi:hypothetical protein